MAGNKGTISRSYDQAVQLLIMAASGIDAMAEGYCPVEVARGRLQAASKTLAGVVAMLVGDDRQAAQLLLEGFVLSGRCGELWKAFRDQLPKDLLDALEADGIPF